MSGPPPAAELRIPTKKDASLREFLGKMDDYAPIIPDAVTNYYLTLAGLPPPPETPPQLARLLALATQKFIADIAADAYQYSRIRSSNTTSNNPMGGLGRTVLTMEDLGMAVGEYGVNVKRGEFYR
ncbi:transcription initiation factor TFIID 23-30kDa subunit-domain-containing protein [Phyllosticta paracitricarpa]